MVQENGIGGKTTAAPSAVLKGLKGVAKDTAEKVDSRTSGWTRLGLRLHVLGRQGWPSKVLISMMIVELLIIWIVKIYQLCVGSETPVVGVVFLFSSLITTVLGFDSISTENRAGLVQYLLSRLILTIFIIIGFIYYQDRSVVVSVFLGFLLVGFALHLPITFLVERRFGWWAYKRSGSANPKSLHKYDRYQLNIVLIRASVKYGIIVGLFNAYTFGREAGDGKSQDQMWTAILGLVFVVWSVAIGLFGWLAVKLKNLWLTVIFIVASFCEPAFIVSSLAIGVGEVLDYEVILYNIFTGVVAILVKIALVIVSVIVILDTNVNTQPKTGPGARLNDSNNQDVPLQQLNTAPNSSNPMDEGGSSHHTPSEGGLKAEEATPEVEP